MKFRVRHTTRYRYSAPVSLCHNVAHLRPRATATQSCDSSQLSVVPAPAHVHAWEDLFGNLQDAFSIQQPHSELSVTALSEVEVVSAGDLLVSAFPIAWEQALEHLREAGDPRVLEARQFRLESNFVEFSSGILEYAAPSFAAGRPLLEAVHDLMRRIHRDFTYDPHFSNIATPLHQVLEHRRGVCQDFAHLAIACLRAQGLAARYVSGYLMMNDRIEQEASHAWAEVHFDGLGWVGFDVSNGISPDERYVRVACGLDYREAAPIRGFHLGGGQSEDNKMLVNIAVQQ